MTAEAFHRAFEAAINIENRTDENELVNERLAPSWGFFGTYTPPSPYFTLSVVRNPVVQTIGDQSAIHLKMAKGTPSNDPGTDE